MQRSIVLACPPVVGESARQLIHFCLCQPGVPTAALGEDGHLVRGLSPARAAATPDVGGKRNRVQRELRVGDLVRRRSRVADVALESGRSGALCFVTVDHEIAADSVTVIAERQTIVYRETATLKDATTASPALAEPGNTTETVDASAALLFRYSALTFNTHRIHYDRPYATTEEGYPGLVVQDPLQATLLIELAARVAGCRPPTRFSFRGMPPAFEGAPLRINAGELADGIVELWTDSTGRPTAMQATARW